MAHPNVSLAGSPAAHFASDTTMAAKRLVTYFASAYLAGTMGTKDPFTIHTSRGQAIRMDQVAVVTQVGPPAGPAADGTVQGLQTV